MTMNELSQAVLGTLAYFDIFGYPLTLVEIWKWLNTDKSPINHGWHTDNPPITHRYGLLDIEVTLGQLTDKIETKNGFYFLKGRQEIIEKRLKRYGYAEDKFKRAVKFIKILRFIPFIKMIAVCNTLAYSNASPEGDIDLFIIAHKNRLWLTRLLTVGFLKIFRVRPRDNNKMDALDANFFLSEDSLDIKNLKIGANDIYLTYWIDQLVPIYDTNNTYQKFQEANGWIKETLPNALGYSLNERRQVKKSLLLVTCYLLLITGFLEKLAKKLQLKIMPQILKAMMNQDTRVVVNDQILKFHRDDRRAEYQEKFDKLLNSLI